MSHINPHPAPSPDDDDELARLLVEALEADAEPESAPEPVVRATGSVPLVCARIRELRQSRGWSQTELGARCSPPMAQPNVARVESRPPHLSLLVRLAQALEVDPGVLVQQRCAACGSSLVVYETGDGLVCLRAGCGWFVR